MFKIIKKEITWGEKTLSIESGKLARQADGAVLARYGDTEVLCTVVGVREKNPETDFFPLVVHYVEKAFAAGKIPGGFFKREGKLSEHETLVSRLIDRSIRPLFPDSFFHEIQVICTVLSHDLENDPDIVAMVGTAAALAISGIPFLGPVAAARVGYTTEGQYLLNPSYNTRKKSLVDLVVAGTSDGVLMVESEAKELSDAVMLGAVEFGFAAFQPVIELINDFAAQAVTSTSTTAAGKGAWQIEQNPEEVAVKAEMQHFIAKIQHVYSIEDKHAREKELKATKHDVLTHLTAKGFSKSVCDRVFFATCSEFVRGHLLNEGLRIDKRNATSIRPISCEIDIVPRVHGSALFTRGETQALVVATLGGESDAQRIDSLLGEYLEKFMLHYNFPPYSVGEVSRLGAPGRREIGHGKLAWRAINPVLPERENFPYTIRVVSEITESNGSSSMATVCGTSLALMAAGVKIARPVAGIAMGLVIGENDKFVVLSDILGDEDHLGDMDFKVAGTSQGITALQMDLKTTSITPEIMRIALQQANEGRAHILAQMDKVINVSKSTVSEFAPRVLSIKIPRDKIKDLIGKGGKVIKEICSSTGAKIDIEDETGTVRLCAPSNEMLDEAVSKVNLAIGALEIGSIYRGKVTAIVDFGAFVDFGAPTEGLLHISDITSQKRLDSPKEVLNVGDVISVRLKDIDQNKGRYKLSMKDVPQ